MDIQIIDPMEYPGWDSLLMDGKNYSFFLTSAWAAVLKKSYGFTPIYFVEFENDRLSFLMPFMEVGSPFYGKKGVSLPFTDQCAPFSLHKEFLGEAVRFVIGYGERAGWKSIEWRDGSYFSEEVRSSEIFFTHDIDLEKTESEILSSFCNSNQRNIKKAVREGVIIRTGQSLDSLREFYRLNCLTRKRHGLPPQPFTFFKNVFEDVISKGRGTVVAACYNEKVIAASVFFHFGKSALFKYGASDMAFQNLRPNNLILWETLKWYRRQGFTTMNLGRTEAENQGLLRYKRTWGAKESFLKYYKYDIRKKTYLQKHPGSGRLSARIFARTPISVLRLIGRLFYKHAG
jgi:hypothetical protein